MFKIFFLSFLSIFILNANDTISSFSKSKKLLRDVYKGHQVTFYSDCKYNYKDKNNMIDRRSCGYTPRNEYTKSGKVNKRARRIEWEHVIPAENFGRQFVCWREGNEECVNSKGKVYKGRKCCTKVNKQYQYMQADLHNLVPAIGELNADRSNFRYAMIEGEERRYGQSIDFEVDFKAKRAEPKEDIRGNIARTYFYFEDRYGMIISKQQKQLLEAWSKQDPVDGWEIERNKRIEKIQGNTNPFISN
ncbi:endonuclease [Candidatus Marinarcus aquaticus]|uniref:Deoxyribonuclease n=1 Tax=Candidatus Marinarcus aquaticus TaxID=2044504 RepID=A0A4Q0XP56_9BACT|nr:endonuclease [Candidatus Marinarcus aquaticus]RXJ54553.1 deoxyribonuclease [Candidatus Marinarcus aquaticus]